jgi:hypothetical protein
LLSPALSGLDRVGRDAAARSLAQLFAMGIVVFTSAFVAGVAVLHVQRQIIDDIPAALLDVTARTVEVQGTAATRPLR